MMEKSPRRQTADVTEPMLHRALRFGTLNFKLVPVICGSAFKNKGVQMLLDAVVNYLPSPVDIPPVEGIDSSKKDRPDDQAQGVATTSPSARSPSRS